MDGYLKYRLFWELYSLPLSKHKILYRNINISTHITQINLSFHQYLLLANKPLLVHTGNIKQVEAMLPQLKIALNGN